MRRLARDESGFTLIELLIALLVVSLGVVAMLGALGVGITSASLQRELTRNESDLIVYAESVRNASYVDCAEPEEYDVPGSPAETVEVAYWDGVVGGPLNFVEDCPVDVDDAPDDMGVQRVLVLRMGSDNTPDGELVLLKRRP